MGDCAFGRDVNPMCHGFQGRRYYTREERKAWLDEYARQLESELKAVRERIQDLSSTA